MSSVFTGGLVTSVFTGWLVASVFTGGLVTSVFTGGLVSSVFTGGLVASVFTGGSGGLGVHRRAGVLKCSQEGQVCAREMCVLLLTNLCDRMWCQLSGVPKTYLDLWGQ